MLTATFQFLKGIGPHIERRLWESGVAHWETFLHCSALAGISSSRKALYDIELSSALQHYHARDARYFARRLKPRDQWRLFETFAHRVLCLDIETTGTSPQESEVTIVGLYGAGRMTTLIQGASLTADRLRDELEACDLLITFFGSVFDVPFLQRHFPGVPFTMPHFDLCFAARRLGYQGGLKRIEREFDIARQDDLHAIDGLEAVHLWNRWRRGDDASLDRLIRYNRADTQDLYPLAVALYDQLRTRFGPQTANALRLPEPSVRALR